MKTHNTLKAIAVLFACNLLLSGCRGLREVEKPVYLHDTVYRVQHHRDSTYVDRWHTVEVKGDTVFVVEKQITSKLITRTDTAYKYVEKPVEVVVEQIKEVAKPLRWWQIALMWTGGIGLMIMVGTAMWKAR